MVPENFHMGRYRSWLCYSPVWGGMVWSLHSPQAFEHNGDTETIPGNKRHGSGRAAPYYHSFHEDLQEKAKTYRDWQLLSHPSLPKYFPIKNARMKKMRGNPPKIWSKKGTGKNTKLKNIKKTRKMKKRR